MDLKTSRAWLGVLCTYINILIFIYSSSLWSHKRNPRLCSVELKGISVLFFAFLNTVDNRHTVKLLGWI